MSTEPNGPAEQSSNGRLRGILQPFLDPVSRAIRAHTSLRPEILLPLSGPVATLLWMVKASLLGQPAIDVSLSGGITLLLVLYSAVTGGVVAGIASTTLVGSFFAFALSDAPPQRTFVPRGSDWMLVLIMLAPAMGLLPSYLRRRLSESSRQKQEEVAEAVRQATFLAEATAVLDTSLGYQKTTQRVTDLSVPTIADWSATYLRHDDGRVRRVAVSHPESETAQLIERALSQGPRNINRRHPLSDVETVLESADPRVITNPQPHTQLEIYAESARERLVLQENSPRNIMIVPLLARNRLIGAMVLVAADSGRRYGPEDLELAEEFCRRAALAIENARLYETAISARSEAESASQRVSNILESISDGFIALDHEWNFTYANGEAERLLDTPRDDLLGRNIWKIFPRSVGSPFYRSFHKAVSRQEPITFQAESRWSEAWLEVHAYPAKEGLSVYFRDVSARREVEEALKKSEEQLRQSQKMEAVGRLAGGVAHDFNNLLTPIGGYAEFVMSQLPEESPVLPDLEEIGKAAERATALTRQLLAFSRKQVHQPQVVDLNGIVAGLEKMLRRVIGEDVSLVTVPDPELGLVMGDPGQMEQVLMNLAVNARDAMQEGGTLMVETRNMEIDDDPGGDFVDPPEPGSYVVLSVSDSGCGIDNETRASIFEPFFTTKEKGKGTGLGLSTVYGIVKQAGGTISLTSKPGRGSTFRIYLKRAHGAVHSPEESEPARPMQLFGGSETVLLVEDEPAVRQFVGRTLRSNGYTVLEAANGAEGLKIARKQGDSLDLVLTDVVMPEMGGKEMAEHLKLLRSDVRLLFMSGYVEEEVEHEGLATSGAAFVQKPFTVGALLRKVREALGDGEVIGNAANGNGAAHTGAPRLNGRAKGASENGHANGAGSNGSGSNGSASNGAGSNGAHANGSNGNGAAANGAAGNGAAAPDETSDDRSPALSTGLGPGDDADGRSPLEGLI